MHLCDKERINTLNNPNNKKNKKESRFLPKCASSLIKQKTIKNLKVRGKDVPSCTSIDGSYTLEAAVIIPLFVGFMVSLLIFFRVMQVQTEVQEALSYASRMTAVECCELNNKGGNLATSEALFRKEVAKYSPVKQFVRHGTAGISLISSKFDGDYIHLKAKYEVKLPIGFFGKTGINICQSSISRKWTGKNIADSGTSDPYVYYTDTGTVYHTTASCRYLDLTVRAENYANVGGLRNLGGAKYYACSCVVAGISGNATVYVTDYGTNYHSSMNCHGLKRTVHMVKLSEVGGKPACSKCGSSH